MPLGPSNEERQRRAFHLLRDQARTAHREGDGLRAAHLCETALQEIERLAGQKQLSIPLHELSWAFIFQLYWLTQDPTVYFTRERLKSVPCIDDHDRAWLEILEMYAFFIEQPLMASEEASRKLKALPIAQLGAHAKVESVELAKHLLELAWYYLVANNGWQEIAELWSATGPSWLAPVLKPVRERLQIQTQLTVPSKRRPPFPVSAAPELRKISDLAELWLLNLHGESNAIMKRVREISPRVNPDDYKWRLIADFWHTNRTFANSGGTDTQGVWLARRRQMTTGFAVLIFHDRRELRMRELLGDVYREHEEGAASKRWHVLQLAMLHELAALRIWDFFMWREAARAQSETLLEAAQWMKEQAGWIAHQGLATGVRAISLRPAEKDTLVQTAVEHLEFTTSDVLATLSTDLFATYPRQRHTASSLLDEIGDLVPPDLWSRFAAWNIEYADESRRNITTGVKINTLGPWSDILPLVAPNSDVWRTLTPEILRLSQNSLSWRSEVETVLRLWLLCAPADLARRAAETMAAIVSPDLGVSFVRANTIVLMEGNRSELGNPVSRELYARAQLAEERLLLARHLREQNVEPLEREVREKTIAGLRKAIEQAVPPEGTTTFSMSLGSFLPGLSLVRNWNEEDVSIVMALAEAVNSPRALRDWIPVLLNAMEKMVTHGPKNFAEVVKPFANGWAKNLPLGQPLPGSVHGPFSVVQIRGAEAENIAGSLGRIYLQLLQKLGNEVHSILGEWTTTTVFGGYDRAMPIALYAAIVIASRTSGDVQMGQLAIGEAILLTLRTRMTTSTDAGRLLASAILNLASIMQDKESELVNWNTASGKITLKWLIDFLESYSAVLAKAPFPTVRSNLALLLWNLMRWYEPCEAATAVLNELKNDRRARVRFNAEGGFRGLLEERSIRNRA